MSTKLPQPKNDTFVVEDGWILANNEEPKFRKSEKEIKKDYDFEQLKNINQFEFQQGIFGQYSHFYGMKLNNSISDHCLKMCITQDSLKVRNLTQDDKLCARECLVNEEVFNDAVEDFLLVQKSDNYARYASLNGTNPMV
jgi:hypothetical protein